MSKRNPELRRRNFLKGATLAGAAAIAPPLAGKAVAVPAGSAAAPKTVPLPNLVVETLPPKANPVNQTSSGGDFMVDVLKTLDLEYCAINPASSFRGIQEAMINHGNNRAPEILTCTHEEIAVHIAQGYAKMKGKPIATMAHGVVGLQHATMALYNAWCDRVPVMMLIGNITEADKRGPGAEWYHAAIDPAAIVRDFVKWDDQPQSLQHFAESAVRAYRFAVTPPMAPVLVSLDAELQENPIPDGETLRIPKLGRIAMPQGDMGAVEETARLLANAENPVIVVDRMARSDDAMANLVALAQTLQCAVVDQWGRTNFPSRHPLNQSMRARAVIAQADAVVGIELNDFWGVMNAFSDRIQRTSHPVAKPGTRTVAIGAHDLFAKANYQDFQRFQDVDLLVAGDGETTLPYLLEAVKRAVPADRRAALEARGKKLADAHRALVEQAREEATIGWDASPITLGRLCAEVYEQIRGEDWSLVGNGININWPRRLWTFDKKHRWNGGSGGAGVGYNLPGSLGGALANKGTGRLSLAFQGDGDFNFAPGTLWTAAHHKIPILYIMHNNRAYHQELMYVQAMADRHARGIENAYIGTTLRDPFIDYATVAKGYGVYAEGPIADPNDLAPALKRAIAVVKRGEPALLDTVVEAR